MSKQMDVNDYATFADEQMNYTYESGQLEGLDPNTVVLFQALNAVIQSNLAIAYEQRTANLLNLFMHIDRQGDMPDHASELFDNIADRLGLREEAEDE